MNLFADLKSRWLLMTKGILFLVLGLLSSAIIIYENQNLLTLGLLALTIWSFCRFYYFLFYVLENYAGRNQKYAGILDALSYLLKLKK